MAPSLILRFGMRLIKNIGILLLLLMVTCKTIAPPLDIQIQDPVKISKKNSPEQSLITIDLIPNSSIEMKKDPFGIRYPIIAKGDKLLFKYTYKKLTDPKLQDAGYSEIIYAELSSQLQDFELKNENLAFVKLFFGRLCFCPGETGYYPVNSGQFSLKVLKDNRLEINLAFKITDVPQITHHISEVIDLDE